MASRLGRSVETATPQASASVYSSSTSQGTSARNFLLMLACDVLSNTAIFVWLQR